MHDATTHRPQERKPDGREGGLHMARRGRSESMAADGAADALGQETALIEREPGNNHLGANRRMQHAAHAVGVGHAGLWRAPADATQD